MSETSATLNVKRSLRRVSQVGHAHIFSDLYLRVGLKLRSSMPNYRMFVHAVILLYRND